MLIDGVYVIVNGKYIGPEKPGPWANLFYLLEIDVFSLGPLFIVFGICWLTWLVLLWMKHSKTKQVGIVISTLTLWYLPIGTLFSLIILLILMLRRPSLN